jgi:hypothetical protein
MHAVIRPTGDEPGEGAEELPGVVGEAARCRAIGEQFPEGPHDEEDHDAGGRVARDEAGPDLRDAGTRAVEEPGADRAADGDHLDLAAVETAPVSLLGGLAAHGLADVVLLVDLGRGHVGAPFSMPIRAARATSDRVPIPPDLLECAWPTVPSTRWRARPDMGAVLRQAVVKVYHAMRLIHRSACEVRHTQ